MQDATPVGLGLFTGIPNTGSSTEAIGSPRFLENPLWTCPALRPRRDLCARPLLRFDVAFRKFDGVGSHENHNFEAQSHGPFTRCLRFAGWVAPPPRKTRFRLLTQLCRTGLDTRRVPSKGFAFVAFLLFRASWR